VTDQPPTGSQPFQIVGETDRGEGADRDRESVGRRVAHDQRDNDQAERDWHATTAWCWDCVR